MLVLPLALIVILRIVARPCFSIVTSDAVQHSDPSREYGRCVQRYFIQLTSALRAVLVFFDFRRMRLPEL
jgi:hypothetical protein